MRGKCTWLALVVLIFTACAPAVTPVVTPARAAPSATPAPASNLPQFELIEFYSPM